MDYAHLIGYMALFSGLNRLRGTSEWLPLPGRSIYYVSAFTLALGLAMTNAVYAVLMAVSYLAWGSLPWGRWQGLGHIPDEWLPDRKPTWFEREIEGLTDNKHLALYMRHVVGLAPLTLLFPWQWQLFAPFVAAVQVGLYEVGWRVTPQHGTVTGEYLVGAYWGYLVWSVWS